MSRLILITNDDGVHAKGIRTLARLMAPLGEVYIVAPDSGRSGAGCSITPTRAIELQHLEDDGSLHFYSCSGTPVDCVKLACEQVVPRQPDLVVSGINHGDNASISLHYSGTMGAVFEACMKGIPAIGFSLQNFDADADFSHCEDSVVKIAEHILEHGLPNSVCLDVNYPQVDKLRGTKVTRLAHGSWTSEWANAVHPYKDNLYWLTGKFSNLEPESEDTDYWALEHGYASITPVKMDMTAYDCIEKLHTLNEPN